MGVGVAVFAGVDIADCVGVGDGVNVCVGVGDDVGEVVGVGVVVGVWVGVGVVVGLGDGWLLFWFCDWMYAYAPIAATMMIIRVIVIIFVKVFILSSLVFIEFRHAYLSISCTSSFSLKKALKISQPKQDTRSANTSSFASTFRL
jgi:hypothetical protein